MRIFRISLVAAAVAALVAAAAASALPSTSVPFTAKYSGQASTKVDDATHIATILANGTGKGTLIGAGTTISFKVATTAQGCGDEGGHVFSLKGYATVLKATGKLAKAKGTLKFTGVYDRDGGTFSVKFTGTLKK